MDITNLHLGPLKFAINEFCCHNIQAQIEIGIIWLIFYMQWALLICWQKDANLQHMQLIIFMVEVWTISSLCVLFFLLWAWPYLFHHDRVCGFAVSEDCGGDVLLSLLNLSPNHNLTRPFDQLLDSTNKDNKTREYIYTN